MTEKQLYNQLEKYDKEVNKLFHENKKLKSRIDKAIEYIVGTNFYLARNSGKSLFTKYLNDLLKILKGEE